jgi:hypothetical protein
MGMHKLFDVDNQPACSDTPSPDEQAELAQYASMNRWFAEQIWGAENLRPVTTKEQN